MANATYNIKRDRGAEAGTALGQSLAEHIPKAIQQRQLSEGLRNFESDSENLTPLQAATRLYSIPGITPQMVQSLPPLLEQQKLAKALGKSKEEENQVVKFPEAGKEKSSGGLSTRKGIESITKGYVPPTVQQDDQRARELFDANPGRFGNNPNNAINYVKEENQRNAQIAQSHQQNRTNKLGLQNTVKSSLQAQAGLLGANKVPGDVYSKIEQDAVKSLLPEEEGGEGLTEEEAVVKYGKELSDADRRYNALRAVGNWTLPSQGPGEIKRNLKSIREQFKEKDDLRNLADSYTSENGLSPGKAYHLAYPVSDNPELSKTLGKLPDVKPVTSTGKGYLETKESDYKPDAILHQMNPKLLSDLGKDGSPLSVAEELDSKGYDSNIWLNYCDENRQKLTGEQADQLNKPRSFAPNLNDIWLFKLSDQDKYVE